MLKDPIELFKKKEKKGFHDTITSNNGVTAASITAANINKTSIIRNVKIISLIIVFELPSSSLNLCLNRASNKFISSLVMLNAPVNASINAGNSNIP